jgi:hypothetical protein
MNLPIPDDLTEAEMDWLVAEGKRAARRNTDEQKPNWHRNFLAGVLDALKRLKEEGIG